MKQNKDKQITLLLCILLLVTVGAAVFVLENQMDSENTYQTKNSNISVHSTESQAVMLTADELLNSITVGYNIGGSLDSYPDSKQNSSSLDDTSYETYQENPIITKDFLGAVKRSGFNAIRIPVTWSYNTDRQDGRLTIRQEWLDYVTEVVDCAFSYNFYVILDSHHDETIIWADMEDIAEVSSNLQELWSQIAEHFKDYDERLIFESFNEIHTKDQTRQYSESSAQAVNILNQLFVDTVRAGGGKNTSRILICDTYLSDSSDDVLNSFVLPKDEQSGKLAISIHSYNQSYNQDIKSLFEKLQTHSMRFGAPIVITEFGTTDNFVPSEYRSNHAGNYIACANEYGIKCFWWDDGDRYGLFDRHNNELLYEDIVESLMNPAEFRTNNISTSIFDSIENYSYASLSAITGSLEDLSDGALTLNPGKQGMPVTYGYGYHINLNISGSSSGLRLSCLCFYDTNLTLLAYHSLDQALSYDITPPPDASFMRISFYNPEECRNLDEYISYFEKNELSLEVTEYIK